MVTKIETKITEDFYIKIGNFILENSLFKIDGLRNYFTKHGINSRKVGGISEDIDNGICGIVLFLVELNSSRYNSNYYNSIVEAGDELIYHCSKNLRLNYGFYKGRAGVSFTLMRIWEITKKYRFLKYALDSIKSESDIFIESEYSTNRLFDGRSGLLLVLIHLYNIKPEKWMLDKMHLCLDAIVKDFISTKDGIIWNKYDLNIKPLNSFLYGSSGVAFALVQFGEYFKDHVILSLAKEIFRYEDMSWNNRLLNWPDFRKEITSKDEYLIHRSKFKDGNLEFFTKAYESHNIASGSAGLCLARLPLSKIKGRSRLIKFLQKALFKLSSVSLKDLSLINGLTGIGATMLTSGKFFNLPECSKRIQEIREVLNSTELSYEDVSLFHGITGIGYFLLQYNHTENFHSVFYPVINQRIRLNKRIGTESEGSQYIVKLLKSCYPYTLSAVKFIAPTCSLDLKLDNIENPSSGFYKLMMDRFISIVNLIPDNERKLILNIFKLESIKIMLFNKAKSNSLNYIRGIAEYEDKITLLNLDEHELLNQSLVFNKNIKIIITDWNWAVLNYPGADWQEVISGLLTIRPHKTKLLLFMDNNNRIIEERLDAFGELTMMVFENPRCYHEAVEIYKDAFRIRNRLEKNQIEQYIKNYIVYFIRRSLLLRNNL